MVSGEHHIEHTRDEESPDHRVRVIQFADTRWKVSERRSPSLGGRLVLVFDCPQALRIVKHYPSDWFSLPDSELAALSLRV